jgi:hypothetical protein
MRQTFNLTGIGCTSRVSTNRSSVLIQEVHVPQPVTPDYSTLNRKYSLLRPTPRLFRSYPDSQENSNSCEIRVSHGSEGDEVVLGFDAM